MGDGFPDPPGSLAGTGCGRSRRCTGPASHPGPDMGRALRLGALLLLLAGVAGCTTGPTGTGAGATASASTPSASVVAADTDVGIGRPVVTHDGLMVRRRVVIAILPTPGADVAALRQELDRAAARRNTTVSDVSPSVLDPADQEALAPDLTVVLPVGATVDDAEGLVAPAGPAGAALPGIQDYEVASVLVHDLRFTVRASNPPALAASIARDGILTDALGSYSTSGSDGRLEITYTGPLLSDALVEVVRGGIARGEGVAPSSVTVSPRSTTGVGVNLADEPAPPVVQATARAGRTHDGQGPVLPTTALVLQSSRSSETGLWAVTVLAGAVWLVVMLLLLLRRGAPPRR
jgi:hypothetical protein